MSVRAKFKVTSIQQFEGGSKVVLMPVTSGSEENALFFSETPTGSIVLGTLNHEAGQQFTIGGEFYVDFTPVPAESEDDDEEGDDEPSEEPA